jgi:hypothetical protein
MRKINQTPYLLQIASKNYEITSMKPYSIPTTSKICHNFPKNLMKSPPENP